MANTDKNSYTILFSVLMVVIVGALLSVSAYSLQPNIEANKRNEKMMNILQSMGVEVTMDNAEELYPKYIKEAISLNANGTINDKVDAFDVNMAREVKKPLSEQVLPLFVGNDNGEEFYIIPLRGKGLWDAIWGYIAIKKDMTVQGAIFDHAGETPGLGAEITQNYFMEDFKGENILNGQGEFAGITVFKGNEDPTNDDKNDNQVDAIAGATITGNGVTAMIQDRLGLYMNYFNSKK